MALACLSSFSVLYRTCAYKDLLLHDVTPCALLGGIKPYINGSSVQYGIEEGNLTPKHGYKSITVKAEIYDYFFNEWLKVKEAYTISKGIRSFSAYVTYRLAQLMEEDKKRSQQE
ncbi:MAG: hypothetical protein ACE14S_11720 [Candidatus Bathyarchaeia archaeon]